jgi:hypothetical protein
MGQPAAPPFGLTARTARYYWETHIGHQSINWKP